MDGQSFISFNLPNTLTIWAMAALLGIGVYGFMQWHKTKNNS